MGTERTPKFRFTKKPSFLKTRLEHGQAVHGSQVVFNRLQAEAIREIIKEELKKWKS